MVSKLFSTYRGARLAAADSLNGAGGLAYQHDAATALATYAATGCLNDTFYANANEQLEQVLQLCQQVPARFVAQTAIYARQRGHMKDMPALLLASLSMRDGALLESAFPKVVDNGRMLRNFVQIMRSGRIGRKSLGSLPKRLVRQWLEQASVNALLSAAIGNHPSLADIIKMVHPKPKDEMQAALFAWLIDKPYQESALPDKVRAYEQFKRAPSGELPDMPMAYCTALALDTAQWRQLAARVSWQTLRMNLNTFMRHGVFDLPSDTALLAERLRDPGAIAKSRVMPYQLLTAFHAAKRTLPAALTEALQDAMEVATASVPVLHGNVVVGLDVSGSMGSPVTGYRQGATTAMRCVDVAALIGACILRKQPGARVMPFDTQVRALQMNPRDSVMSQASRLAAFCGGGTAVSAPLVQLNHEKAEVDLLILVSDNESWRDSRLGPGQARPPRRCTSGRY